MYNRPALPRMCGILSTFVLVGLSSAFGGNDPVVVTRQGGSIAGVIEGPMEIAGAGGVVLEEGSHITGGLFVPGELRFDKATGRSRLVDANRTSVLRRDGTEISHLEVQPAQSFTLPPVTGRFRAQGRGSVSLDSVETSSVDLSSFATVTVKHPKLEVALPPGSYQALTIAEGTVILGSPGTPEPQRYEFQSIDIQPGGRLDAIGPVTLTLTSGGRWRGTIGSREHPLFLDVRVASGSLVIGPNAEFNGFLLAPRSEVTLNAKTVFTGGLVADQLNIRKTARIRPIAPDWSEKADEHLRPVFGHKALRLQRQSSLLQATFPSEYSPAIVYIEDVPYLTLSKAPGLTGSPRSDARERWAIFQGLCTLFRNTRFDRGCLIIESPPGLGQPAQTLMLMRREFESLLQRIGGLGSVTENVKACAEHSDLLDDFVYACQLAGAVSGTSARK